RGGIGIAAHIAIDRSVARAGIAALPPAPRLPAATLASTAPLGAAASSWSHAAASAARTTGATSGARAPALRTTLAALSATMPGATGVLHARLSAGAARIVGPAVATAPDHQRQKQSLHESNLPYHVQSPNPSRPDGIHRWTTVGSDVTRDPR